MLHRRAFLHGILTTVLATGLAVEAHATKVHRIGILGGSSPTPAMLGLVGIFKRALNDKGYVEQRDYVLIPHWAEGHYDRLPALAADMVATGVDIIVAGGSSNALAALKATRQIPIVVVGATAPVELGLVRSLARPGGTVTGTSFDVSAEWAAKHVELLHEAAGVKNVAMLWNPQYPGLPRYKEEADRAARALNVSLRYSEATTDDELNTVLAAIDHFRPDGLIVGVDLFIVANQRTVLAFADQRRIPTFFSGFGKPLVEAGGLMTLSVDPVWSWRQTAVYVDKIIKGAKPSDLPVEQPTRFDFVINMRTARALGLTIPPSLLLRADQVIE